MSMTEFAPTHSALHGPVHGPAPTGPARVLERATVARKPHPSIANSLAYPPLPENPAEPRPRRVGIEVEFGSLSPEKAARCAAAALHGVAERMGPAEWKVVGSDCGDLDIYLDSKYRPQSEGMFSDAVVSLGRSVIPVEIVTEPVSQNALPLMETLLSALTARGAKGSGEGLSWGFGLHLNAELADPDDGTDMPRIAMAYALLEPWLRTRDPLDFSRRLLPFTQRFPETYVDDLVAHGPDMGIDTFARITGTHIASRNHGLDLLPALASVRPEIFAEYYSDHSSVRARPAYHYRLPDSRLGTQGWSLAYEWRRWVLVERVARSPHLLTTLGEVWQEYMGVDADREDAAIYHAEVTRLLGAQAMLAPAGGASCVA